MSNRGFKGYRKPSEIAEGDLKLSIERLGVGGLYIYYTGHPYKARAASLRSNSLAALGVVRRPVALAEWIRKAARIDGNIGYDPARVREGLYLHAGSKPAVYFELRKDAAGNFVSVRDVPNADGFPKGLKKGEIVVAARAVATKGKNLPKGASQAPKAQVQIEASQPEA